MNLYRKFKDIFLIVLLGFSGILGCNSNDFANTQSNDFSIRSSRCDDGETLNTDNECVPPPLIDATGSPRRGGSGSDSSDDIAAKESPGGCHDINRVPSLSDVTDVMLMAGQSNALGENSYFDPVIDKPNNHVLVWTKQGLWQVAEPQLQVWQRSWHPRREGQGSNHPAYQVALKLVEADPCRVVAFIPTGLPGAPILAWDDPNGNKTPFQVDHYGEVVETTEKALAALPNRSSIDVINWIQGESDDGKQNYADQLTQLIRKFRNEPWYSQNQPFIASQLKPNNTGIPNERNFNTINEQIAKLGSDSDDRTHFTSNENFKTPDGTHFDSPTLRLLGERMAKKYLEVTN